jgi:predicted Holliday junction resolvase-like endonuclease
MKIYIYLGLILVSLAGVFYFYRFAYQQGQRDCQLIQQQQIIQTTLKNHNDYQKINQKIKQLQQHLSEKKTNETICRDILNFDVRQCL